MLHIDEKLLKDCDSISNIYCKSFNGLNNLIEKAYPNQSPISDFDLSALCLYLCKCVEYEINCSVVQLLRKCIGIEMPEFFCRPNPSFPRNESIVYTDNKNVYLNDYRDARHKDRLKTIPLGDAYYAMLALVADRPSLFRDFPVLSNDYRFREIWRSIGRIRNEIAHAGVIVNQKTLLECFDYCITFLRDYLPQLQTIKDNIAPDNWKEEEFTLIADNHISYVPQFNIEGYPVSANKESGKPKASMDNYLIWQNLDKEMRALENEYFSHIDTSQPMIMHRIDELLHLRNGYEQNYDWYDITFKKNGKVGLKDITGRIVVPAKYDGFVELSHFLHGTTKVSIAIKDNKYGFVERYSGIEKSSFVYDKLIWPSVYPEGVVSHQVLLFCRDGSKAYGLIDTDGNELVPCIMDELVRVYIDGILFRSGEQYGYFSFVFGKYFEPIYDSIEIYHDLPAVFVKNNVEGYVSKDGRFFSKEQYSKMQDSSTNTDEFVEYYDLIGDWELLPDE